MPYNPGVQDRSGEFIAAGISSGARSIADSIKEADKEAKRLKSMHAFAQNALGMDKDQVNKLDPDTLQGYLEGEGWKRTNERMAIEKQGMQLKVAEEGRRQVMDQDLAKYASAYSARAHGQPTAEQLSQYYEADGNEMPNRPTANPSTAALDALLDAPGAAAHPQFDNLVTGMLKTTAGDRDRKPELIDLGGHKVIFQRATGMFQLAPDKDGGPQAQPMLDEEGNPTGRMAAWTGRGWAPLKDPPAANPAKDTKYTVDSLVKAEESLRKLDEDIDAYHSGVKRDSTKANPSKLQGLMARRQRLEGVLAGSVENTPGNGPTSSISVSKGGVANPKTIEELKALPSGTFYVNPQDGKTYRKK